MPHRTSQSHPIEVAPIVVDRAASIGLTFAPGKHAASTLGDPWARDLDLDLDRLVGVYRTDVLACLLEDRELRSCRIPDLVTKAERRGIEVRRFPIPDGGVPGDETALRAYVSRLAQASREGKQVVIHCLGGLGRTGLVAGCVLIELGFTPADALSALQDARGPRCPETEAQRSFVRRWTPTPTPVVPDREARHLGAVLGAAIGDAMGHPTEFLKLEDIRRRFGPAGVQKFELYWEREGRRFAPYTDDTQMAELVLRCLLDHGHEALDTAMRALATLFVEWEKHPQGGHRAPGNACLAGCRALAGGARWDEAGGPQAGGCGSVMRAWPFGLVFADEPEKAEAWAVAHSKLTHRAPIALAACAALAVGMARVVAGEAPVRVVQAMIEAAGRYDRGTAEMIERARAEAVAGSEPDVTLSRLQGWAAHEAIAAAVYVFMRHADDAAAAILEGANTPGDSDSIASLAGALVGARVGLSGLPAAWVAEVERSDALLALARRIGTRGPEAPKAPARGPTKPGHGRRLDRVLVIDLESTCWEKGDRTAGRSEPIEIGVTVLERRTLARVEKRSILVKPAQSTVSEFCTKLTTLTPEAVARGVSFAEACRVLSSELDGPNLTWASFGDYDRTMMQTTCERYGVAWPLGRTHLNVKNLFALVNGLEAEVELDVALGMIGQPMVGTWHRGDDDAWNIAGVLAWILARGGR